MFSLWRTPLRILVSRAMSSLAKTIQETWNKGIQADDIIYMNTARNIITENGADVSEWLDRLFWIVHCVALE